VLRTRWLRSIVTARCSSTKLQTVAEDGLKLLRQASHLSTLPEYVPGIGGAQFLRINTQEPADPAERRARLAELIDELVDGKQEIAA